LCRAHRVRLAHTMPWGMPQNVQVLAMVVPTWHTRCAVLDAAPPRHARLYHSGRHGDSGDLGERSPRSWKVPLVHSSPVRSTTPSRTIGAHSPRRETRRRLRCRHRWRQTRLNTLWHTLYFPNGWSWRSMACPPRIRWYDGTDRSREPSLSFSGMAQRQCSLPLLLGFRLRPLAIAASSTTIPPRRTSGVGNVLGRAVAEDLARGMRVRPTLTIRAGTPL